MWGRSSSSRCARPSPARISDALFDTWLFTAGKPEVAAAATPAARAAAVDARHAPPVVRSQIERYGKESSAAAPR